MGGGKIPFITVITAVYNREKTIERAMLSVERQEYRNIEYIVVNDGSTDQSNDIIINFMKKSGLPMMYIKKKNGGVHTARNLGIKNARGEMYLTLDSDDELLPGALEKYVNAWKSIPEKDRCEYYEVTARCVYENGREVTQAFDEKINSKSWREVLEYVNGIRGDCMGLRVMKIMKENPWPEPQGVTFVGEDILWKKLRKSYKMFLINDIVRVYHREGDDHISSEFNHYNRKSVQDIRNLLWNIVYINNNYNVSKKIVGLRKLFDILRVNVYTIYLVLKKDEWKRPVLRGIKNRVIMVILLFPSFLIAPFYIKKRCE